MRSTRAFTLIELLVVIAVIALLLAILMPALNRAKDLGRRIVCCSHLRTMGLGNMLYAESHDGWYVPCMDRTDPQADVLWPNNQDFRELIGYKEQESASEGWHAPKEYLCPSDMISNKEIQDSQWINFLSYGYNITDWLHPNSNFSTLQHTGHKETFIKNPSGKLIWTESNDWWLWWSGADYVIGWDVLGQDTITPYKDVGCSGPTLYRHNEGASIAFYDGHVECMKKQKVWNEDDWAAGVPKMWSVFRNYPPSPEQMNTIPVP